MERLQYHFIVLLLCLVAGCTTRYGTRIDESYVLNEIIKGKTTQNEIQNKFGPPHSTSVDSDGVVGWIYPDIEMNNMLFKRDYKNKTLIIFFTKGVVENYTLKKDQMY